MGTTEDLQLDLIRVPSFPGSICKFHLLYKAGNATGIVGVYSYDDNWYYLYKEDTEKYRVKRQKELEKKKPAVIYKHRWQVSKDPRYKKKFQYHLDKKIAENGENFVMENNSVNSDIQKHFGDRFMGTDSMSRFEVLIDHFSKKFSISTEQAMGAYDKTYKLYEEGKVEKFAGYYAAICKSMSSKEYTPEQTQKYIEYNVKQRKDEQLIDFKIRYENGERRVFAPHFGITKKEHNEMAYEAVKLEMEKRILQQNAPDKSIERGMASPEMG